MKDNLNILMKLLFLELTLKTWQKLMWKFQSLSILLKMFLFVFGLFAVTFLIYFFNLDMKATSMIEPFFIKHYDNMERKYYL